MATSALVWGLTSGAAAWFVTWSPVMMDTNTNTYSHVFMLPGVRMNCASFGLGRLSDWFVESFSTTLKPLCGSQAGSKSFGNLPSSQKSCFSWNSWESLELVNHGFGTDLTDVVAISKVLFGSHQKQFTCA